MTEQELIEACLKKNQRAQTFLVKFYWSDIKNYIISLVKDDGIAEELTTATFSKVLTKLNLYNSDFNFKKWMVAIAHNQTMDYLREKGRLVEETVDEFPDIAVEDTENSLNDVVYPEDDLKLVDEVIMQLDPMYREILELKYKHSLTIKEIANTLNLTESNAKVRLMRARNILQQELKNRRTI